MPGCPEQLWERLARRLGWNGNPDTIGDYLEEWQHMGPSSTGGQCFRRRAGILGPNNPPANEWVNLENEGLSAQGKITKESP